MSISYVLTASAEADLRDIVSYTRKQWGETHVRAYTAKLAKGSEQLASGEGTFRDLSDIHAGLRVKRCEHHYLFCLVRVGSPALIIAILHDRMDLMVRLADRLKNQD